MEIKNRRDCIPFIEALVKFVICDAYNYHGHGCEVHWLRHNSYLYLMQQRGQGAVKKCRTECYFCNFQLRETFSGISLL